MASLLEEWVKRQQITFDFRHVNHVLEEQAQPLCQPAHNAVGDTDDTVVARLWLCRELSLDYMC